jgi:hypothetical protein
MTASDAREAAAQCREDARRMDGYVTEGPWKERAARMRLCAVALDAYADGIDAAAVEREACAAICDDADVVRNNDYQRTDDGRATLSAAARAIRARGQP